MNIYKIKQEGDESLIRAKTMAEALKICFESFYEAVVEDRVKRDQPVFRDSELKWWNDEIIESCELIGKLSN